MPQQKGFPKIRGTSFRMIRTTVLMVDLVLTKENLKLELM